MLAGRGAGRGHARGAGSSMPVLCMTCARPGPKSPSTGRHGPGWLRRRALRSCFWDCFRARICPRAGLCSSTTTRSCSRGPSGAPGRPTRRCWRSRTGAPWRVSIDGNGRRVAADPYRGTVEAVLECASNLACVGAVPLGVTNNLNFGNPEKPHIAWQLSESVRGLGDACRALGVAIVGGNVSLYNEGARRPDLPDARRGDGRSRRRCPFGGAAGLRPRGRPDRAGGAVHALLGAAELSKLRGTAARRTAGGRPPSGASRPKQAVREAVAAGLLASAHDIAEGGLAGGARGMLSRREVGAAVELAPAGTGGEARPVGSARAGGRCRRPRPGRRRVCLPGVALRGVPRVLPRDRFASGAGRVGRAHGRPRARDGRGREARDRVARGGDRGRPRGARARPLLARWAASVSTVRPLPAGRAEDREGPRDECGVFGIYAPGLEVSRLSYFALYALQHRGQESAGIAAADVGRSHHHPPRARSREPGLQRERPADARRGARDRARALLDDGGQRVGELPARAPLRGHLRLAARARRWRTTAT